MPTTFSSPGGSRGSLLGDTLLMLGDSYTRPRRSGRWSGGWGLKDVAQATLVGHAMRPRGDGNARAGTVGALVGAGLGHYVGGTTGALVGAGLGYDVGAQVGKNKKRKREEKERRMVPYRDGYFDDDGYEHGYAYGTEGDPPEDGMYAHAEYPPAATRTTGEPPAKKKKGFFKKIWDNGGKQVAIAAAAVGGAYALGKGGKYLYDKHKAGGGRYGSRYDTLQMGGLDGMMASEETSTGEPALVPGFLRSHARPSNYVRPDTFAQDEAVGEAVSEDLRPSFRQRLGDLWRGTPRDGPGEVLFERPPEDGGDLRPPPRTTAVPPPTRPGEMTAAQLADVRRRMRNDETRRLVDRAVPNSPPPRRPVAPAAGPDAELDRMQRYAEDRRRQLIASDPPVLPSHERLSRVGPSLAESRTNGTGNLRALSDGRRRAGPFTLGGSGTAAPHDPQASAGRAGRALRDRRVHLLEDNPI